MKTCLITGASSGIGKEAAVQLAAAGLRVILGCRSEERGRAALIEVQRRSGSRAVELLPVDMALRASIREAAARVGELDVLIHNAASFDYGRRERALTPEGVEVTWATNHLGPVLLTELLLPALLQSPQGRIVHVTSKGLALHPAIRVNVGDPGLARGGWSVPRAYYQSKHAHLIHALWMSRRLAATAVTVNAVRVTAVRLDVSRFTHVSPFMRRVYALKSRLSIPPARMVETYTWLATAPELDRVTGGYFDAPGRLARPGRSARDPAHVEAVMELSFRELGLPGPESKAV